MVTLVSIKGNNLYLSKLGIQLQDFDQKLWHSSRVKELIICNPLALSSARCTSITTTLVLLQSWHGTGQFAARASVTLKLNIKLPSSPLVLFKVYEAGPAREGLAAWTHFEKVEALRLDWRQIQSNKKKKSRKSLEKKRVTEKQFARVSIPSASKPPRFLWYWVGRQLRKFPFIPDRQGVAGPDLVRSIRPDRQKVASPLLAQEQTFTPSARRSLAPA